MQICLVPQNVQKSSAEDEENAVGSVVLQVYDCVHHKCKA